MVSNNFLIVKKNLIYGKIIDNNNYWYENCCYRFISHRKLLFSKNFYGIIIDNNNYWYENCYYRFISYRKLLLSKNFLYKNIVNDNFFIEKICYRTFLNIKLFVLDTTESMDSLLDTSRFLLFKIGAHLLHHFRYALASVS